MSSLEGGVVRVCFLREGSIRRKAVPGCASGDGVGCQVQLSTARVRKAVGKGFVQEPAAVLDTCRNGSYKELLGGKKAQARGACARME